MEGLTLLCLSTLVTISVCTRLYPVIEPSVTRSYMDEGKGKSYFRSLLLDPNGQFVYAGAKSSVYKFGIDTNQEILELKKSLDDIKDLKPNFNDISTNKDFWTTYDFNNQAFKDYTPIRTILEEYVSPDVAEPGDEFKTYYEDLNMKDKLESFLRLPSYGKIYSVQGNSMIDIAQQYSTIYQSADFSFKDHCERQAKALKIFYGNDLQMSVSDLEGLCDIHVGGLTMLGPDKDRLFAVRSGIFGTMPISATGTNDYSTWVELEARMLSFLNNCPFGNKNCFLASNPPFDRQSYDGIIGDPANSSPVKDFVLPSPENYIGKKRHCDNIPGPNRLILNAETLEVLKSDVLIGDNTKESCGNGALVQLLLGGYHPDQKSFTHYSSTGNGVTSASKAIYLIAEIGQEKQLDLMLEYLNLPELYPVTSSASLSIVRLILDDSTGDVDPKSITIINPFKYTWITSPLNRFGRLDKTSSQEQVAYTPKPVGLFEDENFMYFFFREADWESMSLPPYSIRRSHFRLNSYSHSLYFPWEKDYRTTNYIKHEELPGETYEELYAPSRSTWKYINSHLKVTGRVARICKNDAGIPLGLQDPNMYDLDFRLSLNVFQSFLKTRLTCKVPIAGVPFVWRLKKDVDKVDGDLGNCLTAVNTSDFLYGKDLHYRQVPRSDYVSYKAPATSYQPELKYYYLSHCKGYRWSYIPKPVSSSSLYYEYTELRDIYEIDGLFFGVFSNTFANEQSHTYNTNQDTAFQPNLASAICTFTKQDIAEAFNGPFKKKDRVSGGYRPFDPRVEAPLNPSPYECSSESYNANIKNMTIDFLDPSQPYEEETRHFDQRKSLPRLNFFEEDVYGSRTMWNDVNTIPIHSENGVMFEKIVSEKVDDVTVLYISTSIGTIYKIATWNQKAKCYMANATDYNNWLNQRSMSSIWDNKFYAYMNKTDNKATSFTSNLTMEKGVKFPEDMMLESEWNCLPAIKSNIVTVFKPFQNTETKIWDIKYSNGQLILATDKKVLQIPAKQCNLYKHCTTCSRDPHCGWDKSSAVCGNVGGNFTQSVKAAPTSLCSCILEEHDVDVTEDYVLSGLDYPTDLTVLQWYLNGSKLVYSPRQGFVFSHDTSLILLNVIDSKVGMYELRNTETGECLARHKVTLSDCVSDECKYQKKYREWCEGYAKFEDDMAKWLSDYESLGFCTNVDI